MVKVFHGTTDEYTTESIKMDTDKLKDPQLQELLSKVADFFK